MRVGSGTSAGVNGAPFEATIAGAWKDVGNGMNGHCIGNVVAGFPVPLGFGQTIVGEDELLLLLDFNGKFHPSNLKADGNIVVDVAILLLGDCDGTTQGTGWKDADGTAMDDAELLLEDWNVTFHPNMLTLNPEVRAVELDLLVID